MLFWVGVIFNPFCTQIIQIPLMSLFLYLLFSFCFLKSLPCSSFSIFFFFNTGAWLKWWCGMVQENSVMLLPSPSLLYFLQNKSMNRRWCVEARDTTLFGKPAYRQADRLKSQNNHPVRVWMPDSFSKPEREVVRN